MWSADPRQLWSFPARFLVEFFDNHGMLGFRDRPQWRTVVGGSRRYVDAIVRGSASGACGWRRRSARSRATSEHVELSPLRGEPERFDHVVIATHSDQALRMLADASDREHELLGAFPYQRNDVTLHTDRGLLPRRRRAWASWNYHLLEHEPGRPTVTYLMNRLQSLDADRELLVTLNRDADVRSRAGARPLPLRPPGLHRGGRRRAAPSPRARRRPAHLVLRRLLGLGLPRGRRRERAARVRETAVTSPGGDRLRFPEGESPLNSAIYEGVVTHRRRTPVAHAFRFPLFLLYLDLASCRSRSTASAVVGRARSRASAVRDYLGDPAVPLDTAVRDLVQERLGFRPAGPVRMLAHLRYLGHCFNPVAFYWCFAPDRRARRGGRRGGDEHALGRAPRLRGGGRGEC